MNQTNKQSKNDHAKQQATSSRLVVVVVLAFTYLQITFYLVITLSD